MKTSKPISTISYNSVDFLIDTLNILKYNGTISYYEFIEHLPDKDDTKKHIHLYIEPNKVIDTEILSKQFLEDELTHTRYIEKLATKPPLKCINFRSSKFGDWYWYALHDKGYLKSKMLERNLHYSDSDIFTVDKDTHRYLVLDNPLSKYAFLGDDALRELVLQSVLDSVPLSTILKTARIPIGKTQSVISLYNALNVCVSARGVRMPIAQSQHTNKVPPTQLSIKVDNILNGKVSPIEEDILF